LANYPNIGVDKDASFIGAIEMQRPPHNFFDVELIEQIADAMEEFDKDEACVRSCSALKASPSA
jgi:enoyl-CoA hydratase/carnithine racemase